MYALGAMLAATEIGAPADCGGERPPGLAAEDQLGAIRVLGVPDADDSGEVRNLNAVALPAAAAAGRVTVSAAG